MSFAVKYKDFDGKLYRAKGKGFATRQKARQWCRNRKAIYDELWIIHPNGKKERFH